MEAMEEQKSARLSRTFMEFNGSYLKHQLAGQSNIMKSVVMSHLLIES